MTSRQILLRNGISKISIAPFKSSTVSLAFTAIALSPRTRIVPPTPAATAIGAVTAVRREADGRLTGHNTDAHGFVASLRPFLTGDHDRAIMVGAGGAAAAVRYGLAGLGIDAVHAVPRDLPAGTPFRWVRLDG